MLEVCPLGICLTIPFTNRIKKSAVEKKHTFSLGEIRNCTGLNLLMYRTYIWLHCSNQELECDVNNNQIVAKKSFIQGRVRKERRILTLYQLPYCIIQTHCPNTEDQWSS